MLYQKLGSNLPEVLENDGETWNLAQSGGADMNRSQQSSTGLPDRRSSSPSVSNGLGTKINSLRLAHRYTLRTVSERTGISVAMLSMIERGKSNPSIGTLHAIADVLDVSMSELFHGAESKQDPSSDVVRAIAQEVIETSRGVARRLLIHDPSHGFEMAENRYEAGTASAPTPIYHQGFEFGFLLEGELEVQIGDRVHLLRAGDAIRLESSEPHRFRNRGRHPARSIWVNLAPRSTGMS